MEKFLNKLIDLPQLINSKLPENTFNVDVQDSEGKTPKWVGKFYNISALVVLLAPLMVTL